MRNHLPIDGVAHKTTPFTHGLSNMPMINSYLISPALAVPPQSLMNNTYSALKKRVREALLEELARLFPTPGYYHHRPTMSARRFMLITQVHGRTDSSDESRERLPGRPSHLEVPRCRHLLPPLWSCAQVVRTRHPCLPLQTGCSLTPPPWRHQCRSGRSPMVLPPTS